MRMLFDDKMAPITHSCGFIEGDIEQLVRAFVSWQCQIWRGSEVPIDHVTLDCDLRRALLSLVPLVDTVPRRYLFVPTTSNWVCFFDNIVFGTDAFPPMSYLAEALRVRALRVVARPEYRCAGSRRVIGPYPAVILEIYGPQKAEFLNYVRSICATNDGGKWTFCANGAVQDFEETDRYSARRVKERFTIEMLDRYLRALGVSMFDEHFYLPAGKFSSLVRVERPRPSKESEFSLDDARLKLGIASAVPMLC